VQPEPQVGEVWQVHHCRKGPMRAKVLAFCGEWVDLEVYGPVRMMSIENSALQAMVAEGEPQELRVRASFLTWQAKETPNVP
jgi:hypothetical protein